MRRSVLIAIIAGWIVGCAWQANAQMQVERLNRGAVAVRENQGYFISWRLLGDEAFDTGFNIYRGTTKLNEQPVTSATSYYDSVAPTNSQYYIKAVVNGEEVDNKKAARMIYKMQGNNAGYFDIPLDQPAKGENGGTYTPNDASAGDLNGDGEYDIVLKWDPSNSKDNSHSGITDNVIFDGYTLDGDHLWRINLGPNIRAGAHYTQFLVFDFDGDGKAEVMCKTAPGTKDASGNYLSKGPAATADHSKKYRNSSGFIISGPEYLTVFDGETGLELATTDYWPLRGATNSWGKSSDNTNRLDRYNATVAYIDGERPSAVFQRGYYGKMTMAAWNWRNGELTQAWTFSSETSGNGAYAGQGNHSIHVIDANGDGLQDIVTGASTISGTGQGLATTGKGHGDACHVTYMKKDDRRPMVFVCHESSPYGMSLRYADSKDLLWRNTDSDDTGRGCAAELDTEVPGFKCWAVGTNGLCDLNRKTIGSYPSSVNFVIWWDGDLSRELMNGNTVQKWSVKSNSATTLLSGENTTSNNGTKSTPTLQADLFGDWREEVILRVTNNQALRVFTTTMPTQYRLYTLMHDPTYRVAISWQNSSYNQPPHPGYYIASDMDFPIALPNIQQVPGYYRGTGEVIKNLKVYDLINGAGWKISDSLAASSSLYTDKILRATGLSDKLIGKEWISAVTASNEFNGDTLATFEAACDAYISVFYTEKESTPAWLSAFTKMEENISVSNPTTIAQTLVLYEKRVAAGEKIALGPNSSDGNPDDLMYCVVARKANDVATNLKKGTAASLKVYPNPSSSVAHIEYELKQSQPVNLSLLGLNGRQFKLIDNEVKQPGVNRETIDAKNFTAGIYLLRLTTPALCTQQKIVLLKNEN